MPGGSFTAKNGSAGALHRAELRRIQLRSKTTQTKTTDHFQAEIRIRLFCVLEGEGFLLKYKIKFTVTEGYLQNTQKCKEF